MPFYRPALADIRKRVTSDFEYELGTQAARVSGTPERGFVEAGAGAAHGLHGRLAWVARNAFPHSADDDQLARWAALFGVFRIEAERAEGGVYFEGVNGTVIPAGTSLSRADGRLYLTLAEATIDAGSATTTARAVEAGVAGNCDTGSLLALTSPITGISSQVEVTVDAITGGADQETTLALRTRLAARLSTPPNAGGPGSYIAWAKLVAGVTRAWEFGRVPKLGHVTVLFMRDDDPDPPGPFPAGAFLTEVEDKILEYCPLHVQGRLHVQAPIDYPLTLTIELNPNTSAVKANVVAALQAMLAARAEPAAEDGVKFYRSWISEAISGAEGEVDHKLTVPAGDITLAQFELVTLKEADITWV